jgi:hypothetical protein
VTQVLGTVLVVLLVGAVLLREAVALGLLSSSPPARRALDGSILVLAASFLAVVGVHLVDIAGGS